MATKVAKKPKLTVKQAKFVKGVAQGKTKVQAAMDAYPTVDYKTASVMAAENLEKPSIREALEVEFTKQGISMERIVGPINRALEAKKTVILGNGEDAFADVVDDHSVQLKASSMAAQFLGIGRQVGDQPGGVHFHNHSGEKKDGYVF